MLTVLIRGPVLVAVTGACLLLCVHPAAAQVLPPVSPAQLELEGDRIESLTILGGDAGLSGGAYAIRGNGRVDLSVDKFGGAGDLGDPRPIGDGGMKWTPVINGNLGFTSAKRDAPGVLTGNQVELKTWGVELGGGARFWFNDHFSMSPTISGIYGHTEQTFEARNDIGTFYLEALKQAGYVDYTLNTWTTIPALDAKYQWNLGRTNLYVLSTFKYFYTDDFHNTTAAINIGGSSETWTNTLDVDVPIGWTVFGHELHTGGHLDALGLFGNIRSGLDTTHLYTANARLVVDMASTFKFLEWVGLGASYYWSGNVTGWSAGIDVRLVF
jgi:hypothetical protein